jgi:hypothetical protein
VRIAAGPEKNEKGKTDASGGALKAPRTNLNRDPAVSEASPPREESPKSRLGRLLVDSLDRELKRISSDDPEPRDR